MNDARDAPENPLRPCLDGTRLGLGGAAVGNLYEAISDAQAAELLRAAWCDGCRTFDTAPHYGHGRSEQRMGHMLSQQKRQGFCLSSKVGRLLTAHPHAPRDQHGYVDTFPFIQHWDWSADGVTRSIHDSLERLGLDRLDAVYLHDLDVASHDTGIDCLRQVLAESLPALSRLKAQGLVSHVGLGVNNVAIVEQTLAHADLDVVLLAGRYTLLDCSAAHLMEVLRRRHIQLALGGVFNSGLLASRIEPGRSLTFNYAPATARWVERALAIQSVCDRHGVSIMAAALQFALAHPATTLVLLGARSAKEWQLGRDALAQSIPLDLWSELKQLDLIPAQAPLP